MIIFIYNFIYLYGKKHLSFLYILHSFQRFHNMWYFNQYQYFINHFNSSCNRWSTCRSAPSPQCYPGSQRSPGCGDPQSHLGLGGCLRELDLTDPHKDHSNSSITCHDKDDISLGFSYTNLVAIPFRWLLGTKIIIGGVHDVIFVLFPT